MDGEALGKRYMQPMYSLLIGVTHDTTAAVQTRKRVRSVTALKDVLARR